MKKILLLLIILLPVGCARNIPLDTDEFTAFFQTILNENNTITSYSAYSQSGSKDLTITYFIDKKSTKNEIYSIYLNTINFLLSEDIYNYVKGIWNGLGTTYIAFIYEDDEYYHSYVFTNSKHWLEDAKDHYLYYYDKNKKRK